MSIPRLFDRELLARRIAARDPASDFVTALVRDDLAERLAAVSRRFERALVIGPDGRALPTGGRTASGDFAFDRAGTLFAPAPLPRLDPDAVSLPHRDYDLVVSLLDLAVVDDVPGFIAQLKAHMRPDGLLLIATLGGDTLAELRHAFLAADAETSGGASARVAPFLQLADAGPLLQRAGLALPVADIETHTVRHADALALMRDLRVLAAANPLLDKPRRPATRLLLARAAAALAEAAGDADGRIRTTLEIIWMSGWVPHESQQQPARRGRPR